MNNEGFISSYHVSDLLIHDLIKPRKFNCVPAVSRGILSALPRWVAEFTKFAVEFVKFRRRKLWALMIRNGLQRTEYDITWGNTHDTDRRVWRATIDERLTRATASHGP